jgi:ABC-type hemin transport system ATPase subunit
LAFADRVVILERGRVIETTDAPGELLPRPGRG